jgi:hypothetical protein
MDKLGGREGKLQKPNTKLQTRLLLRSYGGAGQRGSNFQTQTIRRFGESRLWLPGGRRLQVLGQMMQTKKAGSSREPAFSLNPPRMKSLTCQLCTKRRSLS